MVRAASADDADTLVRAGLTEARKGRFDRARAKFEQAVKLDPKPVYMHNLARALQKLGESAQAYRWFAQALSIDGSYKFAADARKHLKSIAKKLQKTHARIRVQSTPSGVICGIRTADGKSEELLKAPFERWVPAGKLTISGRKQRYVDGKAEAEVVAGEDKTVKIRLEPAAVEGYLSVQADAPGATVFINGKNVGKAPLNNHLVNSGTYTVEVKAEGYHDFKKTVVVEPDATERVAARLVLIGSAPAPGSDGGGDNSIAGYVLVGGGAAFIIGGAALVGAAYGLKPKGQVPRTPAGDALVAEIRGLEVGGGVLLGLGLVAAGVGIYLLLSEDPPVDSSAQVQLPSVIPTLSIDGTGARAGASLRF